MLDMALKVSFNLIGSPSDLLVTDMGSVVFSDLGTDPRCPWWIGSRTPQIQNALVPYRKWHTKS